MKGIPFITQSALDAADAAKLEAYQANVSNSEGYLRFANKFKIAGVWHMEYREELSQYFSVAELANVIDLILE